MLKDYTLNERLGAGAAATVWRGFRADDADTPLAIKITHAAHARDEKLLRRFVREAETAAALEHPNIVPVLDWGMDGDHFYMVMPYVESLSLEDAITRGAPMTPERCARLGIDLLSALAHAHSRNVLHRDVKAGNVLITRTQGIKLIDFGLALHVDAKASRLTELGTALGTPYYMSLEQWNGREIDHRTDIYAAGVTLYYALNRRFPFQGTTPTSILTRLLEGHHDPFEREVPDALEQIISRALARDPGERWPDAHAMRDALSAWLRQRQLARDAAPLAMTTTSPKITTAPVRPEVDMTDPKINKKLAALPIEIAEGTYWVGKRPPGEIFYANPYVRSFSKGDSTFNLIIDPGSSSDLSIVSAKTSRVIGDLSHIHAVFINHQDPDVGSSAGPLLGRYAPESYVLCTEDTWRLIQYYNIPRERFIALEKYPSGFTVPTGQTLMPVPSPFCHFVGAMMLYDPSTRVLFTGDLFGGLTSRDAVGLDADESDWVGMRAFHQIYMPTNKALRHAVANIRALDPPPLLIAPQHGRLIRGDAIEEFMRRLESLPVGLDIIMDRQASPDELNAWTTVLNRIVASAKSFTDTDLVAMLTTDSNLTGICVAEGAKLKLNSLGKFAVERAIRLICDDIGDADLASAVKYEAVFATNELDLPTPIMELDDEGAATPTSSMLGSI
jgi:serine/threonine-protein kinase